MSRFRSFTEREDEGGIDISPLIDCVFILLIFFIVTTVFIDESGIEVDKPQAASAIQLEKNSILIAISADGAVVYGGRDIGIAGVQPLVKRMTQREEIPVIIQADAQVPSGVFVRVLDEAKLAGATKVSVATRNQAG